MPGPDAWISTAPVGGTVCEGIVTLKGNVFFAPLPTTFPVTSWPRARSAWALVRCTAMVIFRLLDWPATILAGMAPGSMPMLVGPSTLHE